MEKLFRNSCAQGRSRLDRWDLVRQVVALKDDEDMRVRGSYQKVLSLLNEKEMVAKLLCGDDYEEGAGERSHPCNGIYL